MVTFQVVVPCLSSNSFMYAQSYFVISPCKFYSAASLPPPHHNQCLNVPLVHTVQRRFNLRRTWQFLPAYSRSKSTLFSIHTLFSWFIDAASVCTFCWTTIQWSAPRNTFRNRMKISLLLFMFFWAVIVLSFFPTYCALWIQQTVQWQQFYFFVFQYLFQIRFFLESDVVVYLHFLLFQALDFVPFRSFKVINQ